MWNESLADVEGFFRILMLRKYKGLVPFMINLDLQLPRARDGGVGDGVGDGIADGIGDGADGVVGFPADLSRCKVQAILRRDDVMEQVFGKIRDDGGDTYPYGRLITYPSSESSSESAVSEDILYIPDRTRFARDDSKLEPAMAALLYARGTGLKGTYPVGTNPFVYIQPVCEHPTCLCVYVANRIVLPVEESDEKERLAVHCATHPEMALRQKVFDMLVRTWCGREIPLPVEALMSAFAGLQVIRCDLIAEYLESTAAVPASTSAIVPPVPRLRSYGQSALTQSESEVGLEVHRNKLVALTFWYEVCPPPPAYPPSNLRFMFPS